MWTFASVHWLKETQSLNSRSSQFKRDNSNKLNEKQNKARSVLGDMQQELGRWCCGGQLSRSFHVCAAWEGMEAGKQKADEDPGEQVRKAPDALGAQSDWSWPSVHLNQNGTGEEPEHRGTLFSGPKFFLI